MTIQIIKVTINYNADTGEAINRTASFIIDNGGGVFYSYSMGGIPLSGSVQTFLNNNEAALWAEASANGKLATAGEIELAGARAWFVANSGAVSAIFGGTDTSVSDGLATLLTAMFPNATANQRTQIRYALMAGIIACRTYANVEGLI